MCFKWLFLKRIIISIPNIYRKLQQITMLLPISKTYVLRGKFKEIEKIWVYIYFWLYKNYFYRQISRVLDTCWSIFGLYVRVTKLKAQGTLNK